MKKYLLILLIIAFSTVNATSIDTPSEHPINQTAQKQFTMQKMNLQPLAFTENQGQWDDKVLFRANVNGATIWFTRNGTYYQFTRRIPTTESVLKTVFGSSENDILHDRFKHKSDSLESIMIKASFVGANLNPNMIGLREMEYKCNYFIGNVPNEWHTDVPNYEYVLYEDVYPGIDLKYYGNGNQMEYDFIVSPGADPSQIKIRYEGAKSLSVNDAGELEVETEWNIVTEQAPFVYQETAYGQQNIIGKYQLLENNTFGFKMENGYNSSLPLIIDPVLVYSTYLGGSDAENEDHSIAIDSSGSAFIMGNTSSTDFPILGELQTYQGSRDIFVTKLSSSGSSLIFSTYLGGDLADWSGKIVINSSGDIIIGASTYSNNFPTRLAYQSTLQGVVDCVLVQLNNSGDSLIYSSYLGGSAGDALRDIAVDDSNKIYITGYTYSNDFPVVNPFQGFFQGVRDAFVSKISSNGTSLEYSTYLGGINDDLAHGIEVDVNYNIYLTGHTNSTDFPTKNPLQATNQGLFDLFACNLSSAGDSMIYSTYIGGSDEDFAFGIDLDKDSNTYLIGKTNSTDFPTKNPFQSSYLGNSDVIVTKISSLGDSLVYSTYLGGGNGDSGEAIVVDSSGHAHITGSTSSGNFPIKNPYQTFQGQLDVFVTKFSVSGDNLIFSTFLGGFEYDGGHNLVVDDSNNIYVTGHTTSPDFPTNNPYQSAFQGVVDVFIAKFYNAPCGDADGSKVVDISDAVYLIAYIFSGGPAPIPLESGDSDCSGAIDISDAVYLIAYIFSSGPEPCASCL